MKSSSLSSVLLLVILGCLAAASEAAVFTCNATTTATTCQSIIGFMTTGYSTSYGDISALFQVSLSSIVNENNLSSTTSSDESVHSGTLIKVPIPCLCTNGTGRSNLKPVYTVQSGEQLDLIASYTFSQFVNYTEIANANNISDPNMIEVGEKLYIPLPCSCDPVDGTRVVHLAYKVEYGNTVASIAEQFGTTESTLLKLNGISDPKALMAGQILDVPLGQGVGTGTVITGSKSKAKKLVLIISLVIVASIVLVFLGVLRIFIWIRKKQQRDVDIDLLALLDKPNVFSYNELSSATQGFSRNNILGEGGYGAVYKGRLLDGQLVAVKQLAVKSDHGKRQFIAEVETISAVQHRNLVKLHGCCIDGSAPLLMYEYLENGSLDHTIFGNGSLHLDWATRYDICLGIARGLAYLHHESSVRIVHRDIKASNILLDGELKPKISDFGLAKFFDDGKTHISTRLAGTIGYLAPEYAMTGYLTEKTDVFAFGVVVLETVSGRPNSDSTVDQDKQFLLEWAWTLYEKNCMLNLVDKKLESIDEEQVLKLTGIALLCIQASPSNRRPSMSRVVSMLTGDSEIDKPASRPAYLTECQLKELTNIDISEDSILQEGR